MPDPVRLLPTRLRVLSLFSGIGGLDLGLERAGMEVVYHSEIDPYARRVLAKHWPDAPNVGDIEYIEWHDGCACIDGAWDDDEWTWGDIIAVAPVEVVAGGFPCQDISLAGKGAGIDKGDRSGLWRDYATCVRHLRPRYVIVENVSALTSRGLDRVLRDLATLGYGAWWDCVPAAAVGAPHGRDRIFVVATRADVAPFDTDRSPMQWATELGREPHGDHGRAGTDPDGGGLEERGERDEWSNRPRLAAPLGRDAGGLRTALADADGERGQRGAAEHRAAGIAVAQGAGGVAADARGVEHEGDRTAERRSRTEGVRRRPADQWRAEPDVGRVAHGVPSRVDRLRGLGNAVVPQVAQYIGERVVEHYRRTAA